MLANYIIIPVISLRRSEKISNTLADRNYSKLNKKLEFKSIPYDINKGTQIINKNIS